jgi:hypothetical protein
MKWPNAQNHSAFPGVGGSGLLAAKEIRGLLCQDVVVRVLRRLCCGGGRRSLRGHGRRAL